jgi:hypothetical protein
MGQSEVLFGNMLGNTLGTWEFCGNALKTTKNQKNLSHPSSPLKKKKKKPNQTFECLFQSFISGTQFPLPTMFITYFGLG